MLLPFFDIDTDIRPDTDPAIFHRRPEYARDEHGEYGSFFDPEEELEDPNESDNRLKRLVQEMEAETSAEDDNSPK